MSRREKTENNNKKTIITLLLIALIALVGFYLLANTYARYTESLTGTGTGTIARWKFGEGTDGFAFKLEDTNIKASSLGKDGAGKWLLAPGTNGTIDLQLVNGGDVAVKVDMIVKDVTTSATNKPKITYGAAADVKIDGLAPTGTNLTVDTSTTGETKYTFYLAIDGQTKATRTISIPWEWLLDNNNDAQDTLVGKESATTNRMEITVPVTITGTQVDPTEDITTKL